MSNWLSSAVARAEGVSDWLAPQRQSSLALLREAQWPTRKTEAWKYVPINVWDRPELNTGMPATDINVAAIDGLESVDLVFVNGKPQPFPSVELPAGVSVVSMADAAAEDQAWAKDAFATIKPARHLFGLVNDVLATEGVLINVAANTVVERPIRIVHVLTEGSEAHIRVLVRLEERAKATVIEHFIGDEQSRNTSFGEFKLGNEAHLEHYRFALQSGAALSIGGSHFELSTRAELDTTLVGFGSALQRMDVDIIHAGEHAFAKMNALYLLDGKELFDLHSCIEHAVPNGTSEENVRGIVADNSRAVFNGRIHIHRDAQKTLAELNNRNLLMSDRAEINTKPELEIYADDVRCAHGATIAQIDDRALYYMQSRGLSRAQAQIMLNFGFINELVDQMPNQVLADWLRPQLRERFAKMEVK